VVVVVGGAVDVVVGATVVVVVGAPVVVVVGATVVVVVDGPVVVVVGATVVVVVGATVVVVVGATVVVVVGATVVVVVGATVVVVVGATVVVVVGATVVVVVGATVVVVVGMRQLPGSSTVAESVTSWGPGLGQEPWTVSMTDPVVVAGSVVEPLMVEPAVGCGGAVMAAAMSTSVPWFTTADKIVIVRFVPVTVSEFCTCQLTTTVNPSVEHAASPLTIGWCASAGLTNATRIPPAMSTATAA
jgi:hypothetical protein